MNITTTQVVKLRRGHRPLKLWAFDYLAEECVRIEQHRIIEKDVVDADDFFLAQHDVGGLRISLVHSEPDSEMRVVVKISARGNNPVDEAGLDQWNESGNPEPCGC